MNVQSIPDAARGAEALPSSDILGVEVAPLDWDEALALLGERVRIRHFTKVGFLNAHVANIASGDPVFRRILADFLVLPDGIGVDLASKWLYGAPFPANLNGTDFVPAFLASRQERLTVGLVGATRRNAEEAVNRLRRQVPQHDVVLVHDGFFVPEQEAAVLARLEEIRPDVLLVAMGVPRQEFWIAHTLDARHCTLAFAVGALLDFLSGSVPRAPSWMRRMRVEWVYRLWREPGRLWRRYILGNPAFLMRVAMQKFSRAGHGR